MTPQSPAQHSVELILNVEVRTCSIYSLTQNVNVNSGVVPRVGEEIRVASELDLIAADPAGHAEMQLPAAGEGHNVGEWNAIVEVVEHNLFRNQIYITARLGNLAALEDLGPGHARTFEDVARRLGWQVNPLPLPGTEK